jgi:hypothetical protein
MTQPELFIERAAGNLTFFDAPDHIPGVRKMVLADMMGQPPANGTPPASRRRMRLNHALIPCARGCWNISAPRARTEPRTMSVRPRLAWVGQRNARAA